MNKSPYAVIKHRYQKEKSSVLLGLQHAESNKSVSACKTPKYVFVVDPQATKPQIAQAVESIYPGVKVLKVNTINVKPKPKRYTRKRSRGLTAGFKKAVVTLQAGDDLDAK